MIIQLHAAGGETANGAKTSVAITPENTKGDKVTFQFERTGTSATIALEGRLSPDSTFQSLTSQTVAGGIIEVPVCNEYRLNLTAMTAANVKAWLGTA